MRLGAHFPWPASRTERRTVCRRTVPSERADRSGLTDADLRAIDGRHVDDRADAVVVEPEGNQEDQQLAVPA